MADLHTRLEQIDYDTLNGDTARATLEKIKEDSRGNLRVVVELPSGRRHIERFELPETNSDSYRFVRLLESIGYGLVSTKEAIGSTVKVEFDKDGPHIVVPEPEISMKSSLSERLDAIPTEYITIIYLPFVVLFWPFFGLRIYPKWHADKWRRKAGILDWCIEYFALGYLTWFFAWGTISVIIDALVL